MSDNRNPTFKSTHAKLNALTAAVEVVEQELETDELIARCKLSKDDMGKMTRFLLVQAPIQDAKIAQLESELAERKKTNADLRASIQAVNQATRFNGGNN